MSGENIQEPQPAATIRMEDCEETMICSYEQVPVLHGNPQTEPQNSGSERTLPLQISRQDPWALTWSPGTIEEGRVLWVSPSPKHIPTGCFHALFHTSQTEGLAGLELQ